MPSLNLRDQIDNLHERIHESDEIADADAELLIEVSTRLDLGKSEVGDCRHKDPLGACPRLAENVGGLAQSLDDRETVEEIVRYINRPSDNEETNRDYRDALGQFGKRRSEEDDVPESITWIPSGLPTNYDSAPRPSDMLRWEEDGLPMVEETRNSRDAAIIATAWNLRARPFEFQDIEIGDIADSNHGLQVTVVGKRGQRSPTLILAVPHLQRWPDDHPDRDNRMGRCGVYSPSQNPSARACSGRCSTRPPSGPASPGP